MRFRKLTRAQREVLAALRILGAMMVMPNDARPLKALAKRGLLRYRRIDGVRVAVLRETVPQARRRRRLKRLGLYVPMNASGWIPEVSTHHDFEKGE